jgi:transcriptional regulator with XRE-family HTH domain
MANRLYYVLKENQVSQETLAKKLDVTPATVSRWCNNVSQPSTEALYLIAKFLEVEIQYLLYSVPVTLTLKKEINLSVLGVNDAYLQLVIGKTTLKNIDNCILSFTTKYKNQSINTNPILVFSSKYQNASVPVIEVGRMIQNCKTTKLSLMNCQEEVKLMFLCPTVSKGANVVAEFQKTVI